MKSKFLFFLFCILTVQLAAQDVNIEEYEIDKKLNPATIQDFLMPVFHSLYLNPNYKKQ
jgi:hypothetical protein